MEKRQLSAGLDTEKEREQVLLPVTGPSHLLSDLHFQERVKHKSYHVEAK